MFHNKFYKMAYFFYLRLNLLFIWSVEICFFLIPIHIMYSVDPKEFQNEFLKIKNLNTLNCKIYSLCASWEIIRILCCEAKVLRLAISARRWRRIARDSWSSWKEYTIFLKSFYTKELNCLLKTKKFTKRKFSSQNKKEKPTYLSLLSYFMQPTLKVRQALFFHNHFFSHFLQKSSYSISKLLGWCNHLHIMLGIIFKLLLSLFNSLLLCVCECILFKNYL